MKRAIGRRPLIPAGAVLAAIVALADDGFCEKRELALRFRGHGERELRRSIARVVRSGYAIERRGPDGRTYLALSSEGWESIRAEGLNP